MQFRVGRVLARRAGYHAVIVLTALVGQACPGGHEPFHPKMYEDDVEAIRLGPSDPAEGRSFDPFTAFFGERSDEAVRRFIRERIQHLVTFPELEEAAETLSPSPEDFQYDAYQRLRLPRQGPDGAGGRTKATLAANIGSAVWTHAKINGFEQSTMKVHDRTLEIASTRSGIIAVPEDYLAGFDPENKLSPRVRQIFRHAILVHEARHSDCTGGLRQSTIDAARLAFDYVDFRRTADPTCSHMHALCVGGDYAGLPACDSHAWGSYPAGELFLQASLGRSDLTAKDRQVLRVLVRDCRARLTIGHAAMMAGRLGRPDVPHSDAVVPDVGEREGT